MTHLGSQVSALADGQLGPAETEQALAHVVGCPECAEELAAARAAHRALAQAMDVPAAPDLTARLIALGRPDHHPVPAAGPTPSWDGSLRLPGERAPACLPGRGTTPRRRLAGVAGAVAVLAATGLFSLGDRPDVSPTAHRAAALSLLSSAPSGQQPHRGQGTATTVPASAGAAGLAVDPADPGAPDQLLGWIRDQGWACPAGIPEGMSITAIHQKVPGLLEVDLVGPNGVVVVTQEHGRLDAEALARLGARAVQVEGRTLHLLSSSPWHAVWQADDTVVSVVAERHAPEVEALVVAHPHGGYDEGITARIARGWKTVAGAWNP